MQSISAAGLEFIAREEGCVLYPYNDSRRFATIGVGHLLHQSPVTAHDRAVWAGFSKAGALRLLRKDAEVTEIAIRRDVRVSLNQHEFDALCSLIFNIGTGGFHGSTVRRLLNLGDRHGAAKAFEMWHIGGAGLLARRQREEAVFLTPVVDPLAVLSPVERRWVVEYDAAAHALTHGTTFVERTRAKKRAVELRKVLTKRRKRIWLAAQPKSKGGDGHGWGVWHRTERYRLLRQRTA